MKNDELLFINRIKDLAKTAYNQNRYTFSNFLTVEEQTIIESQKSEISYCPYEYFGGHENCERRIIRFGSEEMMGYIEDYPITILLVEPLLDKFSDDLNHRDYLGSLMNLGINRNVIGDILIKGKKTYVFCLSETSEYIISELTRIKHTSVKITKVNETCDDLKTELEDIEVLVSSPRIDAIVASICKISRGKSQDLFKEKKVFINNKICENNSLALKPGNIISIRGIGKFIYEGEGSKTRKDRVYVKLKKYV